MMSKAGETRDSQIVLGDVTSWKTDGGLRVVDANGVCNDGVRPSKDRARMRTRTEMIEGR